MANLVDYQQLRADIVAQPAAQRGIAVERTQIAEQLAGAGVQAVWPGVSPLAEAYFEVLLSVDEIAAAWVSRVGAMQAHRGDSPRVQSPFPAAGWISAWAAASWRAFGTLDTPPEYLGRRSFDGGTDRLPADTDATLAARRDLHRQFDAAERELMEMLAVGGAEARGQPPARTASGNLLHQAGSDHARIPPSTFLNRSLAFGPESELLARAPLLDRLCPPPELAGSDVDPRFPRYHEVLIDTAGLRSAWIAAAEPAARSAVRNTVAAETKFTTWLIERIKASPESSPGKPAIRREANAAGLATSKRAFLRAWGNAVAQADAPAWSTPGRKSKRRVETSL